MSDGATGLDLSDPTLARRHRTEAIAKGVMMAMAASAVVVLVVILFRVISQGTAALDLGFWSDTYAPPPRDPVAKTEPLSYISGVFDSIVFSLLMLLVTMLFAVPVATMAGIYLHEYAKPGRRTEWLRITVSNLAAVPSIVYGLLGLAIFVRALLIGDNPLSAGLTLGILILPILIVSTEEALKTVPASVRQASLAMGATKWQTIRSHVLPYAMPNILTGQIVGLSRAAGETAPLLLIGAAAFRPRIQYGLLEPGAALQARAYDLTLAAHPVDKITGAGAIVVLLLVTILLNLVAIVLRERLQSRIKW